jgi:rod shape determining protein RodA
MLAQIWDRLTGKLDPVLISIAMTICALGMITLYSASNESMPRVWGQMSKLGIALAIMWMLANTPPQVLARFAVPMYVVALSLLLGVAVFGIVINGARRWLNVGVATIQPSELMKIALPLILAWYFNRHEASLRPRDYFVAAVLIGVPFALIVRQPDLGTALLIGASGAYVLLLAGLSWKVILGLTVLLGASLPLIWSRMHDYQRDRIMTLIDPSTDPLGQGYHITQSTIAIGSGGLTGKGWLRGTQTHLDFLPERHTDFIFAVYSEEFGLIGNLVLLVLYLALFARGFIIASNASTLFGRLLAGAITLMFFTYAFVNMGMVSGILPVVGVPLPWVSFGGTALITLFVGLGLLMSVDAHRKLVQT